MTRIPSYQWAKLEAPILEERYMWNYFIGLTASMLRRNVSQPSSLSVIVGFFKNRRHKFKRKYGAALLCNLAPKVEIIRPQKF